MSPRRALVVGAGAAALVALGVALWTREGMDVWLQAAIAFCT